MIFTLENNLTLIALVIAVILIGIIVDEDRRR